MGRVFKEDAKVWSLETQVDSTDKCYFPLGIIPIFSHGGNWGSERLHIKGAETGYNLCVPHIAAILAPGRESEFGKCLLS